MLEKITETDPIKMGDSVLGTIQMERYKGRCIAEI